jgi:molecular chaperone DnaK (HSP70)
VFNISSLVKRNQLLRFLSIVRISTREAGEESVDVTFEVDGDGILNATGVLFSAGAATQRTVTKPNGWIATAKVRRTPQERREEVIAEFGETLFNEEPSRNPAFDEMAPAERLVRIPPRDEITTV